MQKVYNNLLKAKVRGDNYVTWQKGLGFLRDRPLKIVAALSNPIAGVCSQQEG